MGFREASGTFVIYSQTESLDWCSHFWPGHCLWQQPKEERGFDEAALESGLIFPEAPWKTWAQPHWSGDRGKPGVGMGLGPGVQSQSQVLL